MNQPFLKVTPSVEKRFKNNLLARILIDVFDDDLYSSKISFWGNVLLIVFILTSSLEVILSTDVRFSDYNGLFRLIDITLSLFFTIEIAARIYLAPFINEKHKGKWGRIRYIFSFYGLIDILSIIPFWGTVMGFTLSSSFKILRIFRLWRIVRFIPAFNFVSMAIQKKGDEIMVTLLGVLLLSTTISAFLFYAEVSAGVNELKNITQALVWSIGKYTGDYGGVAGYVPVTGLGKLLATVNGLLGIALFALPAGLLGSAFIDEIGEQKKKNDVNSKINTIVSFYKSGYGTRLALDKRKAHWRYLTLEYLQSRILLTENEIIECIRESDNLRFRAMKSSNDIKFNDTKLLEYFEKNCSYGCRKINSESKFFIINPMGATERCISHFTATMAEHLNANYFSREQRIYISDFNAIGSNFSDYYLNVPENAPEAFLDFMSDLNQIEKGSTVLVICSGASGRGDFIVEYGLPKGAETYDVGLSTIDDEPIALNFIEKLKSQVTPITITAANASQKEFSFSVETHTLGNNSPKWIGQTIRRLTGANVITLYININILIDEDDRYFAALKGVEETINGSYF